MDLASLREHLELAERHVSDGERHLARQRELIAELERDGHVATAGRARALLVAMEQSQALHVLGRDRLREKIADAAV
jgi:hypothetical protein